MTVQKFEKIAPQPDPVPRVALSMAEYAQAMGISRSMAYEMWRQGLLKTFRVGRRRFVDVREAQALAARLSEQGGADGPDVIRIEPKESPVNTRNASSRLLVRQGK